MYYGPDGCGDAGVTDNDSAVDTADFDSLDTADISDDDFDDTSWDDVSDSIASDFDDLSDFGSHSNGGEGFSDTEESIYEDTSYTDEDQLSLFETSGDDLASEMNDEFEPTLDTGENIQDELNTATEETDIMDGQVDINEFFEYQEDLHHTPTYDSTLGMWTGLRGESTFIPSDAEAQRILKEIGLEGIDYHEAHPDFSPVTVATVLLSQEDMEELGDAEQKTMANYTLADDFVDEDSETDEETEEETIENVNEKIIESVTGEGGIEAFYTSLLCGETPADLVWHHDDLDEDCEGDEYPYELVPGVIHDICRHRGGRSHSGTKR